MALVKVVPEKILKAIYEETERKSIPLDLKKATLVMISKPMQDGTEVEKFRPICLLGSIEKFYEHLIRGPPMKELHYIGGLSHTQFGSEKADQR